MVKLRSGLCNPFFTVRWKKISYDNKNKNGTESEKSRFPDAQETIPVLEAPYQIHRPHCIQRAFVTCCVLHNILIDHDGYDTWD